VAEAVVVEGMRRTIFILVWTVAFVVLAYLLLTLPFAAFLLHEHFDPPTKFLFAGVMIICPLAAFLGFILGILGKLPGTKRMAKKN
jgi:hypothetical protein